MSTLKIKLFGTYCNEWPKVRDILNDNIYYDNSIEESKLITLNLELLTHNRLIIEHYGKSFGTNGRWDTKSDKNGKIYQDRAIKFEDLILDDVSLKKYITLFPFVSDQLYHTDYFGHNGNWELLFEAPIYEWIIKRFIVPRETKSIEYINETSHGNVFDYSNDINELIEIEKYLKQYASITNKPS